MSIVLLIFLNGCNLKRESIGADNEIFVFTSKENRSDILRLMETIFNDTLFTPEPEPFYKIKFSSPNVFKNLNRQSNLVVASIGNNLLNPDTKLVRSLLGAERFQETISGNKHFIFSEDQFAQNQLFMILSGVSVDDIIQNIHGKELWIKDQFDKKFNRRQKKFLFQDLRREEIEEKLLKKYDWTINIPWGWEIIQEHQDSNWVWLGKEMPYQWISILWQDDLITSDSLNVYQFELNFPQKYYGNIQYNEYKYSIQQSEFQDWQGWKISGIWESLEEAQGGPFLSYIFYDGVTNRTYHINYLIFYPGNNKSIYMRQLDLIAHSFRIKDVKE